MASLSLRHLSKTYPDKDRGPLGAPAVHDLNLEVADNDFLVLAGPAGAGKSTVLRLIAGLETANPEGEILLGGQSIQDQPAHRRDVAMVFADHALYPHLTVEENLGFALRMRGAANAEIKKRVAEAAGMLDLQGLLSRRPTMLSRGEQHRVALGRAVVRQPKVLLLDEPLSLLDHPTRLACRAELIKLHQRLQATTLYVTRDPVEALILGRSLAVLKDGVVRQSGSPLKVYREPDDLFVAEYLGDPPMNLIPGRLSARDGRLVFQETGGGVVVVRFPAQDRPVLAASVGKDVILGVRPEDIELAGPDRDPSGNVMQALVDYVEATGAETFLHLQTGQQSLVARSRTAVDARDAGRRARFQLDPAQTHVFDPASGRRIV